MVKAVGVAASAGVGAVVAQVDFSQTITLGSILLGVLVTALAGFFTIRTQIVNVWRQTAEGRLERIKELEIEAKAAERDHVATIAAVEREQQEIRHQLKDDLAACKAELAVERAQRDLGGIVDRMNTLHHEAMATLREAQGDAVARVAAAIVELGNKFESDQAELKRGQEQTMGVLTEIRDALRMRDHGDGE